MGELKKQRQKNQELFALIDNTQDKQQISALNQNPDINRQSLDQSRDMVENVDPIVLLPENSGVIQEISDDKKQKQKGNGQSINPIISASDNGNVTNEKQPVIDNSASFVMDQDRVIGKKQSQADNQVIDNPIVPIQNTSEMVQGPLVNQGAVDDKIEEIKLDQP